MAGGVVGGNRVRFRRPLGIELIHPAEFHGNLGFEVKWATSQLPVEPPPERSKADAVRQAGWRLVIQVNDRFEE